MCCWFEGQATVDVLVPASSIILGGLPELFQTQWCTGETPAGLLRVSLTWDPGRIDPHIWIEVKTPEPI
jgi:hypothetical protein